MAGTTDPGRADRTTFTLVRAANAGDRRAMEELLGRIRPRLVAWVAARLGLLLGSRMEAEDIVQEVLARAYQALPRFEPRGRRPFYAWLYRIADNRLRAWRERLGAAKRGLPREREIDSAVAESTASPSAVAERAEDAERLLAELARLPDRYREILRLRRLEHLSNEEAA